MTPQEFFDSVMGNDSRYITANIVEEVRAKCKGGFLQYFIYDVKRIVDKWRECERMKKWEEENNGYWDEVNRLYLLLVTDMITQDVYDEKIKELKRPLPLDFYFAPPLPDGLQWALDRFEDDSPYLDPTPQPDTSSGATGTAPEGLRLPVEADTPEARKYFDRAIEREFIKHTSTGFEWIPIMGRGGNTQLGYFLSKIYQQPRPIDILERLFNVKKLSTYLSNAGYEAKRADVKRWRAKIDEIFID